MHAVSRSILFALAFSPIAAAPVFAQAPTTPAALPAAETPMKLPKGVKAIRDIAYVKDGSANQKLDVYLPEHPDQPRPLIVFFHGGAWHKGTKDRPSAAVKMVPRGYVVASVEYRFSQEAVFPAQIYDCKGAIRFLRAHAAEYQIDPARVGVWGTSSGGHLAALVGTSGDAREIEGDEGNLDQSSRVSAVVDCYGPAVLTKAGAVGTKSLEQFIGGPLDEKHDVAVAASPITYVSKDDPPFLILHGEADQVVSPEQSRLFAAALSAAGVETTLKTIPGAGHGTAEFKTPEIQNLIESFLDKHLKPNTPASMNKGGGH